MRGSTWENFKSAAIAAMLGLLAAIGIPWVNLTGQICGGYIVAQFTWVFMVAFDEIHRQRDESRRRTARRRNSER